MPEQTVLDFAKGMGHLRATECLEHAIELAPTFAERAKVFIVKHLAEKGPTSGEDLTDACKAAGIVPGNDDRAFGGVFLSLSNPNNPRIRCLRSDLPRKYGHGSSGGRLWAIVQ